MPYIWPSILRPFVATPISCGHIFFDTQARFRYILPSRKRLLVTSPHLKEINPDIKVLLSSGYSINGKANEILERGCDGFIQKPFNMKDLSQKLREMLD
ncbi:MAG TPA: response regulator [Desulfobacteraceae bacterium]|nr:response regulator [Desulfobacteraceae bacterium]